MSGHRESNPHFLPTLSSELPHEVPQPDPNRRGRRPSRTHTRTQRQYEYPHSPPPSQSPPPHQTPHTPSQPHHTPTPRFTPTQHQTQTPLPDHRPEDHYSLHPHPSTQTQTPPPHHRPEEHYPLHPHPSTQPPRHSAQPPTQPPRHSTQSSPVHPSSNVRIPHRRKTRPHTWLIGAFCALFWAAIFLGGLVVLVVYLLFRPRGPKFDIAAASLNAAYLDMGYLLNADMTILAKFTNPSKKATVDFHYMYLNLYFGNTLISTTYVEPFKAMKAESAFRNVHLVSSQVGLPWGERQRMAQQIEGNRIRFEVKGLLRTRSNLGSLFRYSYWLYGHCTIEVTGPPSGVLVGKLCTTKR